MTLLCKKFFPAELRALYGGGAVPRSVRDSNGSDDEEEEEEEE